MFHTGGNMTSRHASYCYWPCCHISQSWILRSLEACIKIWITNNDFWQWKTAYYSPDIKLWSPFSASCHSAVSILVSWNFLNSNAFLHVLLLYTVCDNCSDLYTPVLLSHQFSCCFRVSLFWFIFLYSLDTALVYECVLIFLLQLSSVAIC